MNCPNCHDSHVVRNTPTTDRCANCGFVSEVAKATLHTDTPPRTVEDPASGYIVNLGGRCYGEVEVSLDMTCGEFVTTVNAPEVDEGEETFMVIERGKARAFITVATAREIASALHSHNLLLIREVEELREAAR